MNYYNNITVIHTILFFFGFVAGGMSCFLYYFIKFFNFKKNLESFLSEIHDIMELVQKYESQDNYSISFNDFQKVYKKLVECHIKYLRYLRP